MTTMRAALCAAAVLSVMATGAPAAWAEARAVDDACPAGMPAAGFTDVPSSNSHAATIDCVVHWKVAQGTGSGRYTPAGGVNRAQMATFISRLITESKGTLPSNVPDAFDDDNGNTHETAINALAAAGVVGGKGNRRYAPDDVVTRDQMATFLVKAFEYRTKTTLAAGTDAFDDDNGTTHEANINRSAAAGFASGVAARQYAPFGTVRRDQMASFLARVLDKLVEDKHATVPPAPPVLLTEMRFVANDDCSSTQVQISGKVYPDGIRCAPAFGSASGTPYREYDLGRTYKTLKLAVGQSDTNAATDQMLRIKVLADGRELFSRDMTFGQVADLTLDVTNVLRLRFEQTNVTTQNRRGAAAAFGDPTVQAF